MWQRSMEVPVAVWSLFANALQEQVQRDAAPPGGRGCAAWRSEANTLMADARGRVQSLLWLVDEAQASIASIPAHCISGVTSEVVAPAGGPLPVADPLFVGREVAAAQAQHASAAAATAWGVEAGGGGAGVGAGPVPFWGDDENMAAEGLLELDSKPFPRLTPPSPLPTAAAAGPAVGVPAGRSARTRSTVGSGRGGECPTSGGPGEEAPPFPQPPVVMALSHVSAARYRRSPFAFPSVPQPPDERRSSVGGESTPSDRAVMQSVSIPGGGRGCGRVRGRGRGRGRVRSAPEASDSEKEEEEDDAAEGAGSGDSISGGGEGGGRRPSKAAPIAAAARRRVGQGRHPRQRREEAEKRSEPACGS